MQFCHKSDNLGLKVADCDPGRESPSCEDCETKSAGEGFRSLQKQLSKVKASSGRKRSARTLSISTRQC